MADLREVVIDRLNDTPQFHRDRPTAKWLADWVLSDPAFREAIEREARVNEDRELREALTATIGWIGAFGPHDGNATVLLHRANEALASAPRRESLDETEAENAELRAALEQAYRYNDLHDYEPVKGPGTICGHKKPDGFLCHGYEREPEHLVGRLLGLRS